MKEEIALDIETPDLAKYDAIRTILLKQVNASSVHISDAAATAGFGLVIGKDKFYIHSALPADPAMQKEQLEKDLAYQKGFLVSVSKKLANERFVQNAKPEVVELERKKMTDAEAKIKAIEESLAQLG